MGIVILCVLLGIEAGFMGYCLQVKTYENSGKHVIRLIALGSFLILVFLGVLEWSFRWQPLFVVLLIQAVIGMVFFVRKTKDRIPFKKKKVIFTSLSRCLLLTAAVVPAVLFPQFKSVEVTGSYAVKTESYTLVDTNRTESYSETGENRKVTVQFWYPEEETKAQQFPLVIFSHGAFGFRGSNYSTFMELASNGYVVCSIDHTYQAFYTKQTDGKSVLVNNSFLNDAMAVENGDYDGEKTYAITREWLELRTDDMDFVLDTILESVKGNHTIEASKVIDPNKIGLFGHSLGGATSASLARERTDIDAVIVLDGTMLGEAEGYVNGETVLLDDAFPVPILNIYNEEHYMDASANVEKYANMVASAHGLDARQIVFKGAGHLNFTDLPLFSPVLAGALGTGSIDRRYCIETMNRVMLNYFDHYLKDAKTLELLTEY